MIPVKLSQLPQFSGDSSGSYIVINDSSNAITYLVNKESFFTASLHGTASYAESVNPSGINVSKISSGNVSASVESGVLDVNTDANIQGNLTASNFLTQGTITAQRIVVQTVSSSIVYSSGSNVFGNAMSDTQQMTGSVTITGSLTVAGAITGTSSYAADANLTGSNGVTRSGSLFQLGGTLNQVTNIYASTAGIVDYFGSYTASFDDGYIKGAIVEDPVTKKIYVGGGFTSYGGGPVGTSLIRLNPDFTIDSSFNVGNGVSGSGAYVKTIILDKPNSKLYVGGNFFWYSGSNLVNHIMRINEDGTIDTSFNTNGGLTNGTAADSGKGIYEMQLDSNGKILVVGNFRSYSGSALGTDANIVRINPDGTKDSTFNNSTGLNNTGYGLAIDQNGKIYVGGAFTTYKGVSANRIVGINSDGSRNTDFNIGAGLGANANPDIKLTTDGKIIVTGNFTAYSGSSLNRIVKINTDGTVDTTFNIGTGFSVTPAVQVVDHKNRAYVGTTSAGTYNGTTIRGLARILSNGSLDQVFNAGSGFSGSGASAPWIFGNSVYTTSSNDYIIVGGKFQMYNNFSSSGLIRIKAEDYGLVVTGSYISYDADYSYVYTSRSLVDRGYIDNRLTGSLSITGSVRVSGSITGSLFGTSSWSSNSVTASYITGSFFTSTNRALSASFALTASFITGSSFSSTNRVLSASNALTASYILNAVSSSFSSTASSADGFFIRQNVTASNARFTTLFVTSSAPSTSAVTITGSVFMTGSITISNMLVLVSQSSLPGTAPTGAIMTSGSGVDNKPYYWNGSTWTALF